ncbi:lipopolysaccharide biosynthesis protein [Aerococcus urinaeequi]|uniref:lipopolysaccharide biosynthesis protein n=1 Tax=Aerococcus urinaeequi TaxID=51665 RepID=UPI003ED936AA
MKRTNKLKINTTLSIINRFTIIISGLILPRLILTTYGSEINGLVSSIGQFLGIITFLDLGVGSVVRAALYRPLAKKNHKQLSRVLAAANKYFKKIAYILVLYVLVLILFYPLLIDTTYGYLSTAFLIVAMTISHFGQYYFGIINELLLSANQEDYIQLGSEIIVVILNLIISIFLINRGISIEVVKFSSSLIYLIRPVYLNYYVKNNFKIDYKIEIKEDPLPQKWHGVGQHIAYTIQGSADVILLTIFSTLENVSIYSVYNMVVGAIKTIVSSLNTGIRSFFGDLYANDEIGLLNDYFDKIEWLIHNGVFYIYGMTIVLIDPFIRLYTAGVEDLSYDVPVFSFLLVLSGLAYSIRTPYQAMVSSAGHFKQTQLSSFIEVGINIFISIALIDYFGLSGLAVGTLTSMTYRTLYLVIYLSNNIIFRPIRKFLKHIFVDISFLSFLLIFGNVLSKVYYIGNVVEWVIFAVILGIIGLFLLLIINMLFHRETMVVVIASIIRKN